LKYPAYLGLTTTKTSILFITKTIKGKATLLKNAKKLFPSPKNSKKNKELEEVKVLAIEVCIVVAVAYHQEA